MQTNSGSYESTADGLRRRIHDAEEELCRLRAQLAKVEEEEEQCQHIGTERSQGTDQKKYWKWPLLSEEYERYARQLILPGVGLKGQLNLKRSSVLIVGAGGLGCPAAAYLAGAGIGHIGIVDGDIVEVSNLHRQIGHSTYRVGISKAESLVTSMKQLNPLPRYTAHTEPLAPENAAELVGAYDLILDCTDHPAVRYLVSDACVRTGRSLVSAAALKMDGQLMVLNWPVGRGPCYRCIFPKPPPPSSLLSCAEGGVLGPVVGIMGVLQALEAIRILVSSDWNGAGTDTGASDSPGVPGSPGSAPDETVPSPNLTLFSAAAGDGSLCTPTVRNVRLKGQRADCFACSISSPLKHMASLIDVRSSGTAGWPDYVQFCGATNNAVSLLQPNERVSVKVFHQILQGKQDVVGEGPRHWLLDVREKAFFDMGSIDGAINIPFSKIQSGTQKRDVKGGKGIATGGQNSLGWLPKRLLTDEAPIYLVCRVGNDSQKAAKKLIDLGLSNNGRRFIGDIEGGVQAWKSTIDKTIPFA